MFTIPAFDYVASPLMVLFFGLLLLIQWRYPLRKQHYVPLRRIIRNISVALPTFVVLRLALLPLPLLTAVWARDNNIGLINWLFPEQGVGAWVGYGLGFLVFDYAYYWWHYATHRVGFLYRFHQVHHSDLDMDTSTAIRFHFVELLMSVAFRVLVVLVFGIGFWVAIVYEVVFETAAQFHHSNWKLPKWVEATINVLFVTPRVHGIHHSIVRDEFNSNWGTVFSLWDRLHGTHRMDIAQRELIIGVPAYRDDDELTVGKLLAMPFRKQRDWKLPNGEQPETRTKTETLPDSETDN
ncbi:sterol desaturase family protein [Spirosoma spitsbergense]|uniref:sterol desaturase family protein n=1 Tax=Spirosoma spitsbergense TaxID=431554 RepID=UPI000379E5B8|nr:sterol desaturase family protein [Spirosoma spitsbergense]